MTRTGSRSSSRSPTAGASGRCPELAGCCPVDLSVVSRHLRTFREAGVVEARKQGKEVLYRVRFDALVAILRNLADALEGCCPPARRPRSRR